jgi:hypothetical protein
MRRDDGHPPFMTLRNYPQHEKIHLSILDKPLDAEMERIPLEERSKALATLGLCPMAPTSTCPDECS